MKKILLAFLFSAFAFAADGPTTYTLRGHATDDAFRTVITSTIKDGNVTAAKLAAGAVTAGAITSGSITAGALGSSAVTAGALASTTVIAGSFTYSSITVDDDGRLTAASNGAAPALVGSQYVTLATDVDLTNERVLTGTANQIIITDGGAGAAVTLSTPVLTGTANQVVVTDTSPTVKTLSLPQAIATASTPTFGGLTLSGFSGALSASGGVLSAGTLGVGSGGTGLTTGTSGGIPYFSGTSTIASSALLTQYGVIYGGGAGATPVATAAGTTGQLLYATTSGAPTWKTVPYCRVYSTSNQSCSSDGTAIITFDSERVDTDSMHSTSVSTSRIVISTEGFYALFAHIEWADTTGTPCHKIVQFLLNGATIIATDSVFHNRDTLANATIRRGVSSAYYLSAGDYVEVRVYQRNNSNLSVNTLASANFSQEFGAFWIGR